MTWTLQHYPPMGDTWVYGEPKLGCGVYEFEGKWEGNVVYPGNIMGIGPFTTKEEAMEACIREFDKIKLLLSLDLKRDFSEN